MSTTTPFLATRRTLEDPDVSSIMARAGLRVRLFMMITVAALPALGVLVFSQYTLHQRVIAESDIGTNWYDLFAFTGGLLLLGGALLSLGFGIAVGEQFLRRPTEALLQAGREWSEGRFGVRIDVGASANTEFGRIATSFNRMAEALGSQRDALHAINSELESRVAERTQALSEANQLLKREMAEREKAEQALRQAQKLQAVGQLAGGIAHDFNNLLTTIMGALDLLRGRLAAQETTVRLVDTALEATEAATRLTSQLLSFSRRQRLMPAPTDMNATVLALSDHFTETLGRAVRVETDLAADAWPVMVDPSQAEAALLNLANNARDAMPDGGTLTIATSNVQIDERDTIAAGNYVAIRVTDTGAGMAEEVVNLAFEPFFTTKEPGQGAGLGLSQVHGLAVQSGGDVRLRSAPGIGTTVSLLLPRADAVPSVEAVEAAAPRGPIRARILVCDDDPALRQVTGDMLAERGYAVRLAASAEDALDILHEDSAFDLLLTDFVMGGMNGLRLIQTVKELFPAIRSMLMTGHIELLAGTALTVDRVVEKPFTVAALDERVSRVLGRRKLHVIRGGAAAE